MSVKGPYTFRFLIKSNRIVYFLFHLWKMFICLSNYPFIQFVSDGPGCQNQDAKRKEGFG